MRLDILIVKLGLTESRERARALIMNGTVSVDGQIITKAGQAVNEESIVTLKEKDHPFVSRGGLKLEKALVEFGINLERKIALDAGASTGGFTDCLLQKGIEKVYAFDVGYGLIHWKLRNDPRVIIRERENIRYLDPASLPEKIDLVVIDLSFISLKLVLPAIKKIFKDKVEVIALIKPQFEVGKGEVGKGGIVREKEKQEKVVEEIKSFSIELGFNVRGVIESPILGQKGNKEFFIYLSL